ncbi:MAG: hypothetical protein IJR93_14240 [Treponema sp.]|nr:hypothetical protein [Treponema sp.]MBQ7168095.1 hypothetical protein [Treponema sp.]
MGTAEKAIAIIVVVLITVASCVCIWTSNGKRKTTEITMHNSTVRVVYAGSKDKAKYSCLHRYDSLEDMKKANEDAETILLLEGACIDKDFIDFLAEKGYEFPVLNSDIVRRKNRLNSR